MLIWNLTGFPKTFCTSLDSLTDKAGVLHGTFHVFVGHNTIIISNCLIYILYIGQNAILMFPIDLICLLHPILSSYTSL